MKKPEWPGIATAVGIVLILTIVIAVASDPRTKLSEWQPLIATMVALLAAFLTFKSAMARVDFDRELVVDAATTKKLALYIALQYSLFRLQPDIIENVRRISAQTS